MKAVVLLSSVFLLAGSLALSGCASAPPLPDFEDVPSAEELYQDGIEVLDAGRDLWLIDTTDYQKAIDLFQDIIDNYPYSEYATLAELKIADAYFAQGHYEEAVSYYRDFADLHPDHEKVSYTIFRAAQSYYKQARSANRDQTATRQAITHLEDLVKRFPFAPEAPEAETLWRELRTRLGQHVMEIGDFYMKREEYQSAADRYRSVLNEYPGLGLDADALYKLGVCYTEMNLDDRAEHIFQVILENYQGSEIAKAAAEQVPAAQ